MNNSIKRAQSQARLSFAERENQRSLAGGESNFRPKVRQYKKLMMTLTLLLTAASGAWATVYNSGEVNSEDLKVGDIIYDASIYHPFKLAANRYKKQNTVQTVISNKFQNVDVGNTGTIMTDYKPFTADGKDGNAWVVIEKMSVPLQSGEAQVLLGGIIYDPNSIYPSTDAEKEGGALTEATFTMPASDVVLTPRYASATIYDADGETEKMAYETLKEAIQNVQNGDVIKLDWDVTFTEKDEPIETSYDGYGVTFTLDLNGHTIDGRALYDPCIVLNNDNDQMTITDSSTDQTGGVKGFPAAGVGVIIFDGGRYYLGPDVDAEYIKGEWDDYVSEGWQLAGGKEFVDLEGDADANDGFTLRVDYAAFELTIGAGRFATFYDTHNITMIEENQNISFYTIKRGDIDLDNNVAKVTKVENAIIPAGLPLLVYNGGQQQQTVKLKVTTTEATPIPDIATEFVGTASGREFDDAVMAVADYYALSGGKMFVPVYETGTIAPHKCWIQFPKQQGGARSITIVFDDATAISTVSGSPADTGDIYDLQGRKVQKPARKGVFIKDGKKKVVR